MKFGHRLKELRFLYYR